MKNSSTAATILLLAVIFPGLAAADEKECKDTEIIAEKIICGDEYLYSLDRKLLFLVDKVKISNPSFGEDNNIWLLNHRNKCEDYKCLSDLYGDRISFVEREVENIKNNPMEDVLNRGEILKGVKKIQPSFNCEEASVGAELMICSNETLAIADKQLAQLLLSVKSTGVVTSLDQKKWILNIRNHCRDVECLSKEYMDRLAYIESISVTDSLAQKEQSIPDGVDLNSSNKEGSSKDDALGFVVVVGILVKIFTRKPKNCFVCDVKLEKDFSYIDIKNKKRAVCARCCFIIDCAH